MTGEGDIEIGYSDWCSLPQNNQKILEDSSGLAFSFTREFHYSHPRTTMLMFGPKNAPAKQNHYIYIPLKNDKKDETETTASFLGRQEVPKGLIMIITQFDGIPMADCFKIVQYWSFEDSVNAVSTTVRIGVFVHFVKYTMLKAQVRDGVKEEITAIANNWCKFALHRVPKIVQNGNNIVMTTESTSSTVRSPLIVSNSNSSSGSNLDSDTITHTTDVIEIEMDENRTRLSIPLKDKRAPRKLPKIFLNNFGESNGDVKTQSFLAILKNILHSIFDVEYRLYTIIILLCIVIICIQWRNYMILSVRLNKFENDLIGLKRIMDIQNEKNTEVFQMIKNHETRNSDLHLGSVHPTNYEL